MRYLMIVQYDGRKYSGWQRQENAVTIQQILEEKLQVLLKQKVDCVASGRTDAGVSAYFQPVHFECDKAIERDKFLRSINGLLPDEIKVLSVVESELHARFSSKKKTYVYKMYVSKIDLPLYSSALRVEPDLDFKLMKKFCRLLVGRHDFVGFRASGGVNESTVRTIYSAKLVRDGVNLTFYITGDGFLYKMVRNIVGTVLEIGKHKLNFDEVKAGLFKTFKARHTAKPEHLFLLNVDYE